MFAAALGHTSERLDQMPRKRTRPGFFVGVVIALPAAVALWAGIIYAATHL